MKIDQNPFSLYDFLGYFIPGSILLYFFYLISINGFDSSIFESLSRIRIGNLEAYLPFVITSYLLGHLQSFLSSYSVERYYLWRYSYPFRFLMKFYHDGYINRKQGMRTLFKRIALAFIILPITFWDIIVGEFLKLNYLKNRTFSVQTGSIVRRKLENLVQSELATKDPIDIKDADNFTLIYHFTLENATNHQQKFANYVALYGFNRSIAFILVAMFWFVIYINFKMEHWQLLNILYLISVSILAYLFYLNFCKFYRRFSLEVVMTFVSLKLNQADLGIAESVRVS